MDYPESDQNSEKVNEPNAIYHFSGSKKLRVFHSFKEAEDAENVDAANKSPVERIKETVQLILRVYGVTQRELNMRKKNNRITITRYK